MSATNSSPSRVSLMAKPPPTHNGNGASPGTAALRFNPKKPSAETQLTPSEAEIDHLKAKLRTQQTRLSSASPQKTPLRLGDGGDARGEAEVRPASAAVAASSPKFTGHLYTDKPYHSISAHTCWESFDSDPEVAALNAQIQSRENRIVRLGGEMQRQHRVGRRPDAVIPPPDPPVFSAAENELMKHAQAAEQFVANQTAKWFAKDTHSLNDSVHAAPKPPAGANSSTRVAGPRLTSPAADDGARLSKDPSRDVSPRNSGLLQPFSEKALMNRRSSSVRVGSSTVAMLNLIDMPSIDIILPGPEEIELDRQGDVLGSKFILKRDLYEAAFTRKDQVGIMSGAPYFRMIPKFNIGGVAQAHTSGFSTILNGIKKVYSGKIVWVNLREEALAYINGRSYIVRAEAEPTVPISATGITSKRLDSVEQKLKSEILLEAERNGGNICVHKESATGGITLLWEAVDSQRSVATVKESFESFVRSGVDVEYHRLPLPSAGARASDMDYVFALCQRHPMAPVVFNCQSGRGRSTGMMVAAAVVRFYQHCDPDQAIYDSSILRTNMNTANFRTLMKLLTVLPNGTVHERRVSILCELAGKVNHLTEKIVQAFKAEASKKALALLTQFATLVCFSAYCEDRVWSRATDSTFVQWIESMPEVRSVLATMTEQRDHEDHRIERMATPSGQDSEVIGFVHNRRGQLLSSNMILRRYPEIQEVVASDIVGVLALRQAGPGVPIFTCGTTTEAAMEDLCYTIREKFPSVPEIHWFNVGSEPSVYVAGVPYMLMDIAAGTNEEYATLHATGERLEELEARLRADVVAEHEASGNGTLVLHHITRERELVGQHVSVSRIQTPRAAKESATSDLNFFYHRTPFPSTNHVKFADFQALLKAFSSVPSNSIIVVADADGGMRTTLAVNVACMCRVVNSTRLRSVDSVERINEVLRVPDSNGAVLSTARFYTGIDDASSAGPEQTIELLAGSSMCQMLAAGTIMRSVQAFISLGGRGRRWNILEALDQYKDKLGRATGDERNRALEKATGAARKYILLLLTAIYLDEAGPGMPESFSDWCDRHVEIGNSLQKMKEHPHAAIKYIVAKALTAERSVDSIVASRRGEVLTPYFGLKADHFPGAQSKKLSPKVPGAPNFRKVDFVNVYGVAIPTARGVSNVLHVLGATSEPLHMYAETPDSALPTGFPHRKLYCGRGAPQEIPAQGRVLWVNLREEPLIYVGDRPFVFRDLTNPYVNVELTGIETAKIEAVEDHLKQDVLNEAKNYEDRFIVHDEGKPGELVGIWESATTETVCTVRKLYERQARIGARVRFVRLPVTDEQSPEMKDFDELVDAILPEIVANLFHENTPLSFVFNCQMGRGRTTTGMVICCLLIGLTSPDYYDALAEAHPRLWDEHATEAAKGNYKCIQQLRSVLADGRQAKRRLDLVLEACGIFQNLRSAIETFKISTENVELTEEARGRAHHHGVMYLQRYFNLMAFAAYLHEEYDPENRTLRTSFVSWIEQRGELQSLHDGATLE